MRSKCLFVFICCCLLVSCSKREAKEAVDALPEIYPDYIGVTVPSNICPMNFSVPGAQHIQALVENDKGESLKESGADHVEMPVRAWQNMLKGSQELKVTVSAWSEGHPEGAIYKPFTIHIAQDKIDPWIAYRLLPPGYEGWNKMGIYQRNITNFDVEPIIENSQNNNGCVNCHSFANYNPKDFTFHARGKNGGWLALLPPILLGFFSTFDLPFQLQCLFFFALWLIYVSLKNNKWRLLYGLLCVPLGFMLMRTPLLATLIVAQALSNREKLKASVGGTLAGAVLLAFTPPAYSQQIAFIPFNSRYTEWGTRLVPLTSHNNLNGEYIKKCVCLATEGRWEELLYKEHARRNARLGNAVSLRYALLAESALGTLPENLLDYPIQDENLFFFPHEQNPIAQQFNRLFYLNLGIYDEAFHQAQEYSLLMPNGNSFSSLRQLVDYSIEENEWDIAKKFLKILSKSSCHKKFIKEKQERIQKSKSAKSKPIPLRADNFVGGYPLPVEMLRLARYYEDSPHRKKMLDYAICSYLIRGDRNSFLIAVKAFGIYTDKPLPKAYQKFLESFQKTDGNKYP